MHETDGARRKIRKNNHPVTTYQGGSGAVAKSDWSPLAGKTCFIWPHNDKPGFRAKDALIAALAPIAAEIRVVAIFLGTPEGWDAADAEPRSADR